MTHADSLLNRIETFLKAEDMSATAFGRAAIGDPNLVGDLRKGRELRLATATAVGRYLDEKETAGALS